MLSANGFAVDAGDAGNRSLWGVVIDQCDQSVKLVGFQDIHTLAFLQGRLEHACCQQVPKVYELRPYTQTIQVGEFEVARSGEVWVAIRGRKRTQSNRVHSRHRWREQSCALRCRTPNTSLRCYASFTKDD